MAGDITTKMGVTGLSEYKRSMNEAAESVKTLDAALKLNEEELKLNGNQEQYMANKAELLKQKIEAQQKVVTNAENALKAMREKGVDPSSTSFQKMQQNVYNADRKLAAMKTELKNVETGASGAKEQASGMNTELQNVGKGIAWQNVTSALDSITSKLESGARAAVNFGKKIAKSAMDSTEWADDILTRASKYGVDAETVQKMDNVAAYIDTDVDTIISAQTRLAKNQDKLGDLLGLDINGKSIDDVFWEAGDAIMHMTDEWQKEEAAQAIFGRSWKELIPLFEAGQQKYNQLMEEQTVMSNDNVKKLQEADDAIKSIQQQVELMKNQFWADNADKIIELMQWLIDNKEGVVAALTAIAGGFGLLRIGTFAANLGKAINGFKELGLLGGGGGAGGAAAAGGGGAAAGGGSGWLSAGASAAKNFFLGGAGTAAIVTGVAIAPAVMAMNETWAKSEETRASRAASAATSDSADAQFLARAAEALVLRNGESQDFQAVTDLLTGLEARQNQQRAELYNMIQKYAPTTSDGNYTWNQLMRFWAGEELDTGAENALLEAITTAMQGKLDAEGGPKVTVEPEVGDGAAADISAQIGLVTVAVEPQVVGQGLGEGYANGLWSVPVDGMIARLHKGERVVPAREVAASRNFSSNLYVESMYMNNGQDADGLAAAMAAAQRRTMSGYGS